MKMSTRSVAFVLIFLALAAVLFRAWPPDSRSRAASPATVTFQQREQAYRANNIGVALLEQFSHKEAAEEFRRALSLDPSLKIAQVNLAIALFNIPDYDAALAEATKAAEIASDRPQPFYILGLIARAQNRTEDAVAAFTRALKFDPQDVGTNVNLGQIYVQQRQYPEAIAAFRLAVEAEPYNSTALYNLATALFREGKREEGQQFMARFQALRNSGVATNIGLNYLEQGRFAEAISSTGAEPELVDKRPPKVTFRSEDAGLPAARTTVRRAGRSSRRAVSPEPRAAVLFDFDDDGDLDAAFVSGSAGTIQLFRNDGGRFVSAARTSGDLLKTPAGTLAHGLVAGDYDNDGLTDLLVFGSGPAALYRNLGKGQFRNVTAEAKLPALTDTYLSGAFVDADHDGDLDVFLGGFSQGRTSRPAPNRLLRNNGDGTFTDVSEQAKIDLGSRAAAVIPTDFDNRRDIDILVLNEDGKPALFRNLRDGTFTDVAEEAGLNRSGRWTSAAVGDFNKDSFSDFFFGRAGGRGVLAVSDGRGKFVLKDAPEGTENASAAQFLDYDNDGLLDLVVQTDKNLAVARNIGDGWTKADAAAFQIKVPGTALAGSRHLLSGDIDADGDLDLLTFARNGSLHFLKNSGGEDLNAEIVRLTGRVSNKSGVGAKIDMRSGSLTQKLESYSASPSPAPSEVHFGLGRRERPDAVRIIWPSGVIQAEIEFPQTEKQTAFERLRIEELDRKPSSCPYLYAWNGERFEFITDFLGGGEMAYAFGTGRYNTPDPDEFVRITSDQLKPRNGKYELRVTNELEEVLYLDRFELLAVDHPEGVEVYPNEGLGIPTAGKFILYTTAREQAPLKAVDGKGRDVLDRVRAMDRQFYDTFESEKIRGYAKEHELTLTLDNRRGYNGRTLLLLTGWTDYAFSSDNVAASQTGRGLQMPKLQVRNARGEWETVIESIGISVGRPQTVVVDLTGKFLTDSREVRIVTNMKTLWDKIAIDTSADAAAGLQAAKLEPAGAMLRERGFSLEVKPDGKEPVLVDYDTVLNDGRWKYFSGSFTRLGDVLPLLSGEDDVFVISKTGDEIALSFNETDLPQLKKGMKRTFLFYAVGYSKEMDINSASPDQVEPLPFRAMTRYPYGGDERFPMTEERRRIYEEYTTRSVRAVFPRIEAALLK